MFIDTLPGKAHFDDPKRPMNMKSGDSLPLRATSRGKALGWGAGMLLAAGAITGVTLAENGHQKKPAPVPSLGAVSHETGNLDNNTPTLSEDQVSQWPARETVVATTEQSRDGVSAIVGAIDPEVYSGSESNDATKKALEANLDTQTAYGQGNVQPGEVFSVANIHPNQANAITGGNHNIPSR